MVALDRWWSEHRALLLLVFTYSAVIYTILALAGLPTGGIGTVGVSVAMVTPIMGWGCVLSVIAYGNRQPVWPIWRERAVGALTVALLTPTLGLAFSAWKQALIRLVPFSWDAPLFHLSVALHGRAEWEWFGWVLTSPSLLYGIDTFYGVGWGLSLLVTLAWAAWLPDRRLRTRYLVTHVLSWIVLGSVGAALFGSGGPILYHLFAPEPETFTTLRAILAQHPDLTVVQIADLLTRTAQDGQYQAFTGISAMPSMHVAQAMLTGLLLWHHGHWGAKAAGLVWVALVLAGSVILGWHYAIDGYVAIAATLILWHLSARMTPATVNRP